MKRALLERLVALKNAKIPVMAVTDLSTGLQTLLTADTQEGGFGLTPAQRREALRMLAQDRSGLLILDDDDRDDDVDGAARLLAVAHNPPPRLLLAGAGLAAQILAPMAELAGYAVTVLDAWPDAGATALNIDSRVAVAVLTHDPQLGDPALIAALPSPAFYVGAVGAGRVHAKRLERLRAAGVSEGRLARLQAPLGLAINAKTPGESAVAILAQISAALRRCDD